MQNQRITNTHAHTHMHTVHLWYEFQYFLLAGLAAALGNTLSSRSGVCSPSFYGNNAFDRSKPLRESMPFVPALPSRCMTPSAFPTPKTLYMLPKWIACIAPCNPLQSIAVFVSGSDGSC